jgi:hypothetical protein
MNRTTLPSLLLGLFVFVGCAASSAEDEEVDTTDEELATNPLHGYFDWDGQANTSRWLGAIALHRDGTFEANIGNNVSNLSGHHHPGYGTYTVASTANGGKLLTLDYDFFGHATERYDVTVQGDSLKMKLRDWDGADWFTVHKKKAATLTFAADWTVSVDGPLVAGAPLVVRYAASRNSCTAPADGGLSTIMHAKVDGQRKWWVVQQFGRKPVKGVMGSVGYVPEGHHLSVWFENGAVGQADERTCTSWDSRFGANYYFPIAQP